MLIILKLKPQIKGTSESAEHFLAEKKVHAQRKVKEI